MNVLKVILIGLFILFQLAETKAQSFLRNIDPGPDQQISLADMQRSFNEWKQGKDLTKVKGWKWYKRWEDEQSSRLNPDGAFVDQSVLFEEAIRVNQQKQLMSQTSSGWAPVGPTMLDDVRNGYSSPGIGRINCVTFHPTNPNIIWAGVAQGGVWKTNNAGASWTPLTDNLPIIRVSDIAIDPLHPDTMYICLGDYAYLGVGIELDNRHRNIHYGIGVYKTTDGGLNWAPTGLNFNLTDMDGSLMRRVFVNPQNNQQLVAAGISGVWRSNDGGATWQNKLTNMIWDIEQDPVNPEVLYASSAFVKNLQKGNSGIYKSIDFGNTWTELLTGMPQQDAIQRIELAISPSDPNYIYAIACNLDRGFYGIYKTTNAGLIWTSPFNYAKDTVNILDYGDGRDGGTAGQATYDLSIMVDPENKDKVFIAGINIWGSIDGGSTWNPSSYWYDSYGPSIHADQHFLRYNPTDKKTYICNDGGMFRTDSLKINKWTDGEFSTKWEAVSNEMAITSFYRLGLSANNEGYIIGGSQDNSTYYKDGLGWANIFGGDGMECMIDPLNPNVIYGSSQFGSLYRSDDGGFQQNYISPANDGEWTTPMFMDPKNANTIYAGYGNIFKSTSRGDSWDMISNFPPMPDAGFASPATSIAVSALNNKVIYAAKRLYPLYNQKSELYRTTNEGAVWTNITTGLPDSLYFKYISVDAADDKKAWLAVGGFVPGVKAFKTVDGGNNWINISNGLPNVSVNCIIEDKTTKYNTLYAATDLGVYYSNDTLNTWKLYSQNLPNVIASELEIHYKTKKLYVATFGRGMWMTDVIKDSIPAVGVNENNLEYTVLSVYPNPSHGSFKLEIKGLDISEIDMEILNVMGARIYSEKIIPNGKEFNKIYQNMLKSGLYFVRIHAGADSRTLKLIIN